MTSLKKNVIKRNNHISMYIMSKCFHTLPLCNYHSYLNGFTQLVNIYDKSLMKKKCLMIGITKVKRADTTSNLMIAINPVFLYTI